MTIWLVFIALICALLALDLGVLNRRPHVMGLREALAWSAMWISIALLFNLAIYFFYEAHWFGLGLFNTEPINGTQAAIEFFTAYLVEKSLSVDNLFVFALIFSYFQVPVTYQRRVLFWGIIGALIMRGIMIAVGVVILQTFHWVIYIFGGVLLLTGLKLLLSKEPGELNPETNILLRLARRVYRITDDYEDGKFFSRVDGKLAVTPLFLVLLVVESTDLVFAIDSIPAVLGVSRDPFIIFTSNVFAILGLRALYFAVAALLRQFRYLRVSLAFVLVFIGVKMLLSHLFPVPAGFSLGVILSMLTIGIVASVARPKTEV